MTTSTILLAEEHDATRGFLADNLTADGYRVLIAADRAKAIALLTRSAARAEPWWSAPTCRPPTAR